MKNKFTMLLTSLMMLMFFSSNLLIADTDEDEIREKLPLIAGSSNVGKEFVFTIPPVYEETGGNNFIKIFITSGIQTKVQVEIKKYNKITNGLTIPNDVIGFDLSPTEGQPFIYNPNTMKGRAAQVWDQAGIRITAEDPIVVYVMCKYRYTSDGFLALPVSGLGREYIVATYNDMGWGGNQFFPPWAGITAAYDNTDVNITMGGNASSEILTDQGAKIKPGQKIPKFRLQKGDVYMFSSNGPFQDITGSKIISNKPISLVSGHFCTNIPLQNQWCDYTVDMQLPTNTWGKLYHVPAYTPRRYPGIIRVFAKEDNTNVFRDGQFWFNLKKGGGLEADGWLETRVWPRLQDNGQDQRPKNAVISSDKPIGITYYNPGTQEDAGIISQADSDPFIMTMTPVEQYQNEITFCTPSVKGGDRFGRNFINVVYELNQFGFMPDDFEFAEVKGGRFTWKPFNSVFGGADNSFVGGVNGGTFDANGKKYGSKQVLLGGDGVYKLRSKTGKFACYSYGFNDYESYGYPTSAALNDLTIPDVWKPKPEWEMTCQGNVTGKVTDMPWPGQDNLRSNLNYIAIDNNTSYNYRFEFNPIEGGTTITTSWKLDIINPLEDAKADLIFIDRAGNDTIITIEYSATKYEITADHNYGQFQLGQDSTFKFTIKNLSETKPVIFQDLSLKSNNQGFSIVTPLSWDITKPVEPLGTREVEVKFTADDKLPADKKYFTDSLGIGHECGKFFFVLLEASTGAPTITVGDHDYGKVNLNITQPVEKTISIRNDGDATLIITGYTELTSPEFTTNLKTDPLFANISPTSPLTIPPTQAREFKAYFKPTATITYTDKIVFTANSDVPDPVCELKGEGIQASLSVNSYDWPTQRIDRPGFPIAATPAPIDVDGNKILTLVNGGSANVSITNVVLKENKGTSTSFVFTDGTPLTQASINAKFANKPIIQGSKLTEEVLFKPTVAGEHDIELTFNNSDNIADVVAKLTGKGTEPFIQVTQLIPFGSMIAGDAANTKQDLITISNPANTNGDVLTISDITLVDVSNDKNVWSAKGFRYDGENINIKFPIKIAPNEAVKLPVEFLAPAKGNFQGTLTFVSDATVTGKLNGTTDFTSNNITSLTGEGQTQGADITANGAQICKGNTEVLVSTFTNTGSTDLNVVLSLTDPTGFVTFTNPADANFTVAAGGSKIVTMDFKPTTAIAMTQITLTATTDIIVGNKVFTTTFDVGAYEYNRNSKSDISKTGIKIADEFNYSISIVGQGNNTTNAGLNKFDVQIDYPGDIIKPDLTNGIKMGTTYAANWKFSNVKSQVMDAKTLTTRITLTIEGNNANVIFDGQDGELLVIKFKAFLPTYADATAPNRDKNFTITHSLIETGNDCFEFIQHDPAVSNLGDVCGQGLRNVVISGNTFGLSAINPNPVGNGGADIKFSVGFECPTTIKIFSVEGAVVSELVNNENMPAGSHTVKIPVEKLANGVYMYEMVSGPFTSVEKLIIQK